MAKTHPDTKDHVAVIDVGSNSVRMVIYHIEGRAVWPVFNEKLLAGLGQDLKKTGRLHADGAERAITVLKRFRALLDSYDPSKVHAVATAAVRDADDGDAFLDRVITETGIKLKVISGAEEARLSAMGVIAGNPEFSGIAADLGGASLELVEITDTAPHTGLTLPLGPFSLDQDDLVPDNARDLIRTVFQAIPLQLQSDTLCCVGGAWRNLALVHMHMTGYPLHIVHQYGIDVADLPGLIDFVNTTSPETFEEMRGLSRKRIPTLPYAAALMQELANYLSAKHIQFSAYGLREGVIFDQLDANARAENPMLAGASAMGNRYGQHDALAEALFTWTNSIFENLPPAFNHDRDRSLRQAACAMSNLGARLHTDNRGSIVFAQTLRAPFTGITHQERAFLAMTLFHRHASKDDPPEAEVLNHLLSPKQQAHAMALGFSIRLGCDLSGRAAYLLPKSQLFIDGDRLRLTADPDWANLILGDPTKKRLHQLATLLNLTPDI